MEKTNNPGIPLSDQHCGKVFHLLSLVLFLDYFQGEKTLEVDIFWIEGEKNLVSDCLQLPPSISSSAPETARIDLDFHTFQKVECLLCKGCLLMFSLVRGSLPKSAEPLLLRVSGENQQQDSSSPSPVAIIY